MNNRSLRTDQFAILSEDANKRQMLKTAFSLYHEDPATRLSELNLAEYRTGSWVGSLVELFDLSCKVRVTGNLTTGKLRASTFWVTSAIRVTSVFYVTSALCWLQPGHPSHFPSRLAVCPINKDNRFIDWSAAIASIKHTRQPKTSHLRTHTVSLQSDPLLAVQSDP